MRILSLSIPLTGTLYRGALPLSTMNLSLYLLPLGLLLWRTREKKREAAGWGL